MKNNTKALYVLIIFIFSIGVASAVMTYNTAFPVEIDPIFTAWVNGVNLSNSSLANYMLRTGTNSNISYLQFNTNYNSTLTTGQVGWNADKRTPEYATGLGNIIQIGQESWNLVKNSAGVILYEGDVVSLTNSSGEMPQAFLANANATNPVIHTLAMVTIDSCNVNTECVVTLMGEVHDLNTSMFAEGDEVYLKSDETGKVTNIKQQFPNYNYHIGTVLRSHHSAGIIYFKPEIDFENGVTIHQLGINTNLNVTGNISSYSQVTATGTTELSPFRIIGQKKVSDAIVESGNNTGALEYANNTLYFTNWKVRRTVVQAQGILLSDINVTNNVNKTVLYNLIHGPNYLVTGKQEEIYLWGVYSASAAGALNDNRANISVDYNGVNLGSFLLPKNQNNKNVETHIVMTTRSTGNATTSIQFHVNTDIEGSIAEPIVNKLVTGLNSLNQENITVYVQWTTADPANSLVITQGRALSIDNN